MPISKKQISSQGIAQVQGLETLIAIPVMTGQFLNYNTSYTSGTLSGADDYTLTTSSDFVSVVLTNQPPTDTGEWYKYHTSGGGLGTSLAPLASTNLITFIGGTNTICGIYQKLSNLTIGSEYLITVDFTSYSTSVGDFHVDVFYTDENDALTQGATSTTTMTSVSRIELSFTAYTTNDIVVLSFKTASTASVSIYNVTVQRKDEYLVPTFETDEYGNLSKVLKRNT